MLKFLKKLIGLDGDLAKGQHKITNAPVRNDIARVMRQVRSNRNTRVSLTNDDDLSTIRPYNRPSSTNSSKSSSFLDFSSENSCGDDD